jgi:endonuclease/exonuclease/phosphatase family metal-dependent hydrolase
MRFAHAARAYIVLAALCLAATIVPSAPVVAHPLRAPTLRLVSYNVYYGGRLEDLFLATTQEELFQRVGAVWSQVLGTDLPGRAARIADEIASVSPHVVGLQETPLWRTQFPGDGPASEASTVRFDFLALVLDALAARGQHYAAVASNENLDAELPRFDPTSPTGIEDIRLTDRDVILARTDLPATTFSVANALGGSFEHLLTIPAGVLAGGVVPRGWTSIDVTLSGRTVRVINTHLERVSPADQVAQAQELLAGPANTTLPVVLIGDLNSAAGSGGVPGESDTSTYDDLSAAGFDDAWLDRWRFLPGFTCCQDASLTSATALSERIDVVLLRGRLRTLLVWRLGERERDRTATGFWPSDHAGLSAIVRLDR